MSKILEGTVIAAGPGGRDEVSSQACSLFMLIIRIEMDWP